MFLLGTFWEPWHAFSYNDAKGTLLPQPTRCTSPNVQGKRRHSSPAWLSGFSRRGQQVRHRPPQTAWCFPSLLEIPLPRLHHLAPGNCSIKTTTRNRKCVVIVSCMFHVSQTPTSFVGDSAEFRPPQKKIRAEELLGSPGGCHLCYHLIESQRRLLHWTVHLNGDEV